MIEDGDRVLVAVSGGVDSSVLARVLAEKRGRLPVRFDLLACHVAADALPRSPEGERALDGMLADLGIPLVRREISISGGEGQGEGASCFYCAMRRRMALLDVAAELGCRKIAYGHHLDDVVVTLLMNMMYRAEISTMPARLELDRRDAVIIRPLCRAKESEIERYARRFGIVATSPPCPRADVGRRRRVKEVVAELAREDSGVRDNLYASLGRVRLGYLLEKTRESVEDDRGGTRRRPRVEP